MSGALAGVAAVLALTLAAAASAPLSAVAAAAGQPVGAHGLALVSFNQYTSDVSDPGFALDPDTHQYRRTQYTVYPSPDGQWGYAYYGDKGEWALATYADAVHSTNLNWQPIEGEIVQPPGEPFPRFQGPTLFWAAEGHTLIKANQFSQTTTYVDAATGHADVVRWPADLVTAAPSIVAFGAVSGDRVSLRSFPKDSVVTTWLLDRHGRVTANSDVRITRDAFWFGGFDVASPDGRYLIPGPGVLLDTLTHQTTTFLDTRRQSGPSAGFVVGWYDNTHFMQTSRGESGRPITLSAFDTRGRIVRSLPLTMLPLADDGRTDARLVPAGIPGTEGAVTFRI